MTDQALALVPPPTPTTHWYRVTIRRRAGRGLSRTPEHVLIEAADAEALQAQLAEIRGRVDGWHLAKPHTCSACQRTAPWDDGWGWYGSYADLDAGTTIVKTCSPACFTEAKRTGLMPRNAETIVEVVAHD